MGKPVPGWDVDVLDEDGEPRAGRHRRQHRRARRPTPRPVGLFPGYDGDDEATRRPFRDGWYYTGDKAWRDGDGYLWFEGRDDDVITSSAYRIGPFEVESALIEHPAVQEAAVVGKDDPERTADRHRLRGPRRRPRGLATSSRRSSRTTRSELTAPYKYPREIHFVDELPKTVSGKIRRTELREQLNAGGLSVSGPARPGRASR